MTVRELGEKLMELPGYMEVVIVIETLETLEVYEEMTMTVRPNENSVGITVSNPST